MTTGSVTLLDAAKSGSDLLKAGVVETLIQESPILEQLPQTTIHGNAIKHEEEVSLPSPEFRSVNESYNRSFGSDKEHFWGTAILGGEVYVDNYLVKVRGNVQDIKRKQFVKMAKAMGRTFDKTFFDGTGAAKDFKGVNTLITEGFGQLYGAAGDATNGGSLTLADLDVAHDLMRGQSQADALLCSRAVRRAITNLARGSGVGYPYIDVAVDLFGRQITTWNGIPIRIIGDDVGGTAILGADETRGSSTDCSSAYLVSYGEDENVTGLLGAGGSFEVKDFGETEASPGHLGRVEVYPGIAIYNKYSIVRVDGIRNL